jgi:MFS family permease
MFEGYMGIRAGDERLVYDTLLLLVLLLLALFAIIFRIHFPLFVRILNEPFSMKERQSLFDERTRDNPFFTGFLKFQALFLCALFAYLVYGNFIGFQNLRLFSNAGMMMIFFGILGFFYLFKQCMYLLNGFVFSEKDNYKHWNATYHNLFCLWGISLYVPVLWLILDHEHPAETMLLFAFIYACFRFTLIYMTVRIFYNKNTGILYLSSYLCAQEIVPLLFLYEGMNYLYNTIEVSTLWH